eukprot:TRINITY_DN8212_c0_g1_i2.p1 TRINITY_DN8212_c0_g1~~TRINITY_DN8212_c0_g1_i2.p1  ORF type:complete len:103 (-),score=15.86 TRINITY_DN8212_c0_g1_i2:12-320(-)
MKRIWIRNLGRDDRVLSDHGREARHPFLDENLMKFLWTRPLWHVCDLSENAGMGDKKILRLVSDFLGIYTASRAQKRAIQFGTDIAKQFPKSRTTKGTDSFQ